jgi:hypothetical protein
LSPFRPTMMRVRRAPDPEEVPPIESRVYVESLSEFADVHQLASLYKECEKIHIQFFEIEEGPRPISSFRLSPIPVLRLRHHREAFVFWPREKRAGRGPKAADISDDDLPEDVDEAGGEADASHDGDRPREEEGLPDDILDAIAELTGLVEDLPPLPPPVFDPPPSPPMHAEGGSSSSGLGVPPPAPPAPEPTAPTMETALPPAPVPLPPEPVAGGFALRGRPGRAIATCRLRGGAISYYRNGNYEAVCSHPDHGRCRMTRAGNQARGHDNYAKGRPLGLLAAWLDFGQHCNDQAEHRDEVAMMFTQGLRLAARRELLLLPGGDELAVHEKDSISLGSEHEPEDIR